MSLHDAEKNLGEFRSKSIDSIYIDREKIFGVSTHTRHQIEHVLGHSLSAAERIRFEMRKAVTANAIAHHEHFIVRGKSRADTAALEQMANKNMPKDLRKQLEEILTGQTCDDLANLPQYIELLKEAMRTKIPDNPTENKRIRQLLETIQDALGQKSNLDRANYDTLADQTCNEQLLLKNLDARTEKNIRSLQRGNLDLALVAYVGNNTDTFAAVYDEYFQIDKTELTALQTTVQQLTRFAATLEKSPTEQLTDQRKALIIELQAIELQIRRLESTLEKSPTEQSTDQRKTLIAELQVVDPQLRKFKTDLERLVDQQVVDPQPKKPEVDLEKKRLADQRQDLIAELQATELQLQKLETTLRTEVADLRKPSANKITTPVETATVIYLCEMQKAGRRESANKPTAALTTLLILEDLEDTRKGSNSVKATHVKKVAKHLSSQVTGRRFKHPIEEVKLRAHGHDHHEHHEGEGKLTIKKILKGSHKMRIFLHARDTEKIAELVKHGDLPARDLPEHIARLKRAMKISVSDDPAETEEMRQLLEAVTAVYLQTKVAGITSEAKPERAIATIWGQTQKEMDEAEGALTERIKKAREAATAEHPKAEKHWAAALAEVAGHALLAKLGIKTAKGGGDKPKDDGKKTDGGDHGKPAH